MEGKRGGEGEADRGRVEGREKGRELPHPQRCLVLDEVFPLSVDALAVVSEVGTETSQDSSKADQLVTTLLPLPLLGKGLRTLHC